MTFDTLQYVDAVGTTHEVALSAANLSANGGAVRMLFKPASHAPDTFEIIWAQPPETGIAIPFKSRCIVRLGRTSADGSPGSFSGGTIVFQGRRTDNSGQAGGNHVSTQITLSDFWWDLQHVTYAIPWNYISGGTLASPTYSTYLFTDIVMFQAAPGTTYSPAAVNGTITTWQQIQAIIDYARNYATGDDAVDVQLAQSGTLAANVWTGGTTPEFAPTYVNWYPIRAAKCAECLLIALRPHPGVFKETDHSTTPPTFHLRNRGSMTAIDLPYKSTLADGTIHLSSEIQPLNELVPDAVRIWYKINSTFNGQPVVTFANDCYPSSANSLLCLDFSVDVTGATQTETIYNFTAQAFDPTQLSLWREKVPPLRQISEGGQIPNDGNPGALQLLDTTINGGTGHPDGLLVVDESGSNVNLGTYLYYTDADVFDWMEVSGSSALVTPANVVGMFAYNKNTGGNLNLTPKIGRHSHSMRLKLTNAPSGRYVLKQTLNTGESIPANLAQNIYTELSVLQWRLRHEIFQEAADAASIPTFIKPGKHKVNLTGGDSVWTTMNAVPESVTIELMRSADGRLVALQQITCGPVNHLDPAYMLQLYNLFWNRNRSGIDAYQRLTGNVSSTQVDLSNQAARENSVPGTADFQQHIVYSPDAIDGTRSIVMNQDASTGQTQVVQKKTSDGTTYTTGLIAPEYSGLGAPTSTTLPANTYYRVGDRYIDTTSATAPIAYRCMTAGTNSTSVWAQISSSSASSGLIQCKIVSDGGDYWVCKSWDGTTLGTLTFNVIKPFKLRAGTNKIASEVIRGVTYTYTYSPVSVSGVTGYYTRQNSGSDGSLETAYVIPDPLANDIIYAINCTTNVVSGIPVTVAAAAIANGGSGYVSGDVGKVLTVAGGTGTSATLTIGAVSAGAITAISVTTAGNYTVAPSLTANAATGSTTGTGATFNLTLASTLLDVNVDGRRYEV